MKIFPGQNVLWPEDIQCPIVVGLAGLDKIVPAKSLRRFLLSHPTLATPNTAPPSITSSSEDGETQSEDDGNTVGSNSKNPGKGNARQRSSNVRSSKRNGGYKRNGHGSSAFGNGKNGTFGDSSGGGSNGAAEGLPIADKGRSVYSAKEGGAEGNEKEVTTVKRVELVYWSEVGHGHALGDPQKLSEFMRVVAEQERVFASS